VLCLLIIRRPGLAFGALMATYAMEQWVQTKSGWFVDHGSVANILTGLMVVFGVTIRFMQGKLYSDRIPKLFWTSALLFAYWCTSLVWSPYDTPVIDTLKSVVPYWIVYFFLPFLLIADWRDLRSSLHLLLFSGLVFLPLFLFTVKQADRSVVLDSGSGIGSIKVGKSGNPLAISSYAGYVALAAALLNFRGVDRFWQLVRWPLVIAGLALALKSGSRGQIVAFVIAGLVFFPMSRRIKNIASFVGFAIGIVLFMYISIELFSLVVEDETRWQKRAFWDAYRYGRVEKSLILLREWFGAGPVAWIFGLGAYASYTIDGLLFYPHVVMAEILGECGFIGFFLLWLVPVGAYKSIKRCWPFVKDDPEMRGVLAATSAILFFEIILSFKQGSFFFSQFPLGVAIVLARLAECYERDYQDLLQFESAYDLEYFGGEGDEYTEGELVNAEPARY